MHTLLWAAGLQLTLDSSLVKLPGILEAIASSPVIAQANTLDQTAAKIIADHVTRLERAGYSPSNQGVWLQTNSGDLLASHQATRPLPVASLTKAATTLAALSTWSHDHRFITLVGTNGRLQGTVLQGDLIVEGSGDPLLVWEEAIALGNTLNRLGIRQVQGNLIVSPKFYMNFEPDPRLAAAFLTQAFNSGTWNREINSQFATLPPGTPRPSLKIGGKIQVATLPSSSYRPLVRHFSLPLWQILKRMNIYSNNAMSEMIANALGGAAGVTNKVIQAANLPTAQIRLINGSGLGQQNQISPRAVVAILIAIHNLAQAQRMSLADYFPGGECNCGTLEGRQLPPGVIAKTGTLSDVSTLAGVLQVPGRGAVWFAIINRGAGDLSWFHSLQEQVLADLSRKWQPVSHRFGTLMPSFRPIFWQDQDRNQVVGLPLR
ncbi:MAG: D-alanyl-D-alanine carboxypeptidase [Pseudanabaenaceae cyanobacterium bins.68]|nr:D-alanyl-D-alanine carboxypeptidase [Pseudanabaenaceae cyanobacterium bins.68]